MALRLIQRFSLPRGATLVSYNSGMYRDDTAVGQFHMCIASYCECKRTSIEAGHFLCRHCEDHHNVEIAHAGLYAGNTPAQAPEWGNQPLRPGPSGPLERTGDCVWLSRRTRIWGRQSRPPPYCTDLLGTWFITPIRCNRSSRKLRWR